MDELFRHMYPPEMSRPETMAAIGLVQPTGALFPLSEMQSRIFCEYLQGPRRLPSREKMYEDIRAKADYMKTSYVNNTRYSVHVKYMPYIHELAAMIDAEPSSPLWYLLKGDPKLARALAFGPCVPYKFRLRGPHTWEGARDAIVTLWDRVVAPTKTRAAPTHVCGAKRRPGWHCYLMGRRGRIVAFSAVCVALVYGLAHRPW